MRIEIEPKFSFTVVNEDWGRPFTIRARAEEDGTVLVLCEFTAPESRPLPEPHEFMWFGAVRVEGTDVVEAWPVITTRGQTPTDDREFRERAKAELVRHRCGACARYVNFIERSRPIAAEVIEITLTCPVCGHVEVDYLD